MRAPGPRARRGAARGPAAAARRRLCCNFRLTGYFKKPLPLLVGKLTVRGKPSAFAPPQKEKNSASPH